MKWLMLHNASFTSGLAFSIGQPLELRRDLQKQLQIISYILIRD